MVNDGATTLPTHIEVCFAYCLLLASMRQFMGPGETSWSTPKAKVKAAGSIRPSKVKPAITSPDTISSSAAAAASASSTATTSPVESTKTSIRKQSEAKKSPPDGGGSSEGAASVKGKRKKKEKRVSVEGDSTLSGVKRARSPGVVEEGTEVIADAGAGMETGNLPETPSLVGSPSKGGRPRSKSPAASSASWRGMYWSAGSPTPGSASGGEGGRGVVRSSRAKSGGGFPGIVEAGKSATAHKRFRIKAQKAAEGMAAQAAYEEAKRQRLPPEEAAAKLAAAAVEAAKLAAKTSSIGGNLSKHLIDLKAAEVSGGFFPRTYLPVCAS